MVRLNVDDQELRAGESVIEDTKHKNIMSIRVIKSSCVRVNSTNLGFFPFSSFETDHKSNEIDTSFRDLFMKSNKIDNKWNMFLRFVLEIERINHKSNKMKPDF